MNTVLIERIRLRLRELNKSMTSVSQEALGGKETLRKILDGSTANPRIDTLQKLAVALETTTDWLTGISDERIGTATAMFAHGKAPISQARVPAAAPRIPVMGTAAGSHLRGAFQLEQTIVDHVACPPALTGARDIYALFVEGSSMDPQYAAGDLIYIHPHRPARADSPVVVQTKYNEHGPVEATLGIYLRMTEKGLIIGKHNPKAEIVIPRETIIAIHKVMTLNELFGV